MFRSVSCSTQFEALQLYLEEGGAVLVMMTEGGEAKHNTNINFLLEEFGIMANSGEGEGRSWEEEGSGEGGGRRGVVREGEEGSGEGGGRGVVREEGER